MSAGRAGERPPVVELDPDDELGGSWAELLEDHGTVDRGPGEGRGTAALVQGWLAQPLGRVLVPALVVVLLAAVLGSAVVDRWSTGPAVPSAATVAAVHRNGPIAVMTDRGLELVDPESGTRRTEPGLRWHQGRSAYEALTWSPDGRRLGYVSDATAGVHPMDGGPEVVVGGSLDPGTNRFVWSADGTTVHQWGADVVARLASGGRFQQVDEAAWSTDGQWMAVIARRQGQVGVYLATADLTELREIPSRVDDRDLGPARLAWSPDGRRLACLQSTIAPQPGPLRESLVLLDPDGGEPVRLADAGIAMQSALPGVEPSLAWAPDSTAVALVANRTGTNDGWALSVVGLDGTVRAVPTGSITSPALAWRPVP